jgi:predicted kinase
MGDDDDDGWNTVPSRKNERKSPKGAAHPDDSPFMIVLSGIPGSGKSHFAQALAQANPKYVRICQDVLGSRAKCERASRASLSIGKVPIIDRCNFSPSQRESFLVIAKEHNATIDCIVFQYSQNECLRRCEERPSHETLDRTNASGVVSKMAREYEPPFENTDLQNFRLMKFISSFRESNAAISEYLHL